MNIEFINDNRPDVPELLMVSGKDYARYIEKLLTENGGLAWVAKWDNYVCFTTPYLETAVPRNSDSTFLDKRQAEYEIECCSERGVTIYCKIYSRADSVCDKIFSKSMDNQIETNIPYGLNGEAKPTRRKKSVIVYQRNILPSDEYGKGLLENTSVLETAINDFINNNLPHFEDLIK